MSDFKINAQDIGQKTRQFVAKYGVPAAGFGFLGTHIYNAITGYNTPDSNPWMSFYAPVAYMPACGAYISKGINSLAKRFDGLRLGNTINLVGGACMLTGALQSGYWASAISAGIALFVNYRSSYLATQKTPQTESNNTPVLKDKFVQAAGVSFVLNALFGGDALFQRFIKNDMTTPMGTTIWPVISSLVLGATIFNAKDRIATQQANPAVSAPA